MLTIHGVPLSVHTRKVILAALHKDIAHQVEPVIPFQPPAGWRELSPTGLIPAITEEAFSLADSAVICAYLERTHPQPPLYPSAPRAMAQALWLEAYAGSMLFRQLIHPLFTQKVIRPKMLGQDTDDQEVRRILEDVQPQIFGYLEEQVRGTFLVGDHLSIADLAIASNLLNHRYLGLAVDDAYPKLAGYLRAIAALPIFRQALAIERPFAMQLGLDLTGFD